MKSKLATKDESCGVMTSVDDKIKFQNGFGTWQNATHECDYDTVNEVALAVWVHSGQLP